MKKRRNAVLFGVLLTVGSCVSAAVTLAIEFSDRAAAQETGIDEALPPFEFRRVGAKSPEAAATTMFRAVATESPKHFVQHLCLGVCDGPIATIGKFAESLHLTTFRHGEETLSVYDLPSRIDPKRPIRAVASQEFDREDKQVKALQFQAMSTYGGEEFRSVDVVGESYDGVERRTRIVVALANDRWYAIPRCRSSKSFYEIADAMQLPSPEAKDES